MIGYGVELSLSGEINHEIGAMGDDGWVGPSSGMRGESADDYSGCGETGGVFAKWDRANSPGCALGVYHGGQIVYKRGYGMEDLNEEVHITPGTVFHVASMSKQFTAASIVLLAQQGKLSLDDDVRKYIPELPDFGQKITIGNLVHHTSGLRDQWALLELAGWRYSKDLITNEDVMSLLTRQKELNFKPGERHLYSNTGYTLLGLIVKRVSGMSLREFTTKNILNRWE